MLTPICGKLVTECESIFGDSGANSVGFFGLDANEELVTSADGFAEGVAAVSVTPEDLFACAVTPGAVTPCAVTPCAVTPCAVTPVGAVGRLGSRLSAICVAGLVVVTFDLVCSGSWGAALASTLSPTLSVIDGIDLVELVAVCDFSGACGSELAGSGTRETLGAEATYAFAGLGFSARAFAGSDAEPTRPTPDRAVTVGDVGTSIEGGSKLELRGKKFCCCARIPDRDPGGRNESGVTTAGNSSADVLNRSLASEEFSRDGWLGDLTMLLADDGLPGIAERLRGIGRVRSPGELSAFNVPNASSVSARS